MFLIADFTHDYVRIPDFCSRRPIFPILWEGSRSSVYVSSSIHDDPRCACGYHTPYSEGTYVDITYVVQQQHTAYVRSTDNDTYVYVRTQCEYAHACTSY